ncbi:hypothetical protein CC80DRAFT_96019 [Byssothecium circinans]|uniref:Uncharacterized protein n=1 Tax=Byssothecium circinans TaxID=147558 RepID=A0A6A5UCN9_9PLEO|nr:hypothetical protein CC80DRAFT_96019 [Byssothecium circinans]
MEVLFGLCDKFLIGELPFSCLNARCERSLREWEEKRYLRHLILMGIMPLFIQDGDIDTKLEHPIKPFEGSAWYRTKWKQGKKRACFEFMVPLGIQPWQDDVDRFMETAPRRDFIKALLKNEHGWRITVENWGGGEYGDQVVVSDIPANDEEPLEVGATSWIELLLPLKHDRTLQPARGKRDRSFQSYCKPGQEPEVIRESYDGYSPIVRVELAHFGRRLDEMIYSFALDFGVPEVYNENDMKAFTVNWGIEHIRNLPAYFAE